MNPSSGTQVATLLFGGAQNMRTREYSPTKKEFQLLVAQEGPSETDDERRYRHERVSALAALHRALSSTSKFGFNVFGVRFIWYLLSPGQQQKTFF